MWDAGTRVDVVDAADDGTASDGRMQPLERMRREGLVGGSGAGSPMPRGAGNGFGAKH